MKSICVFCGSSTGKHPRHIARGRAVGEALAKRGIRLVYGGATVGVMGAIASGALKAGGEVHGVLPAVLRDREIALPGLTQLHLVDSMHERKALMYDLSDAFITLPGGMGTLDELCEILTWGQLGLHQKPCGVINDDGYFNHLIAFFEHATSEGFIKPQHRDLLVVEPSLDALLDHFARWRPPTLERWIQRKDT